MKVKCVKNFYDKTSAENIKDQTLITVNEILECDDELAIERIRKGFVIPVEEFETTEETEAVNPVEETEAVNPVEETGESEKKTPRKKK